MGIYSLRNRWLSLAHCVPPGPVGALVGPIEHHPPYVVFCFVRVVAFLAGLLLLLQLLLLLLLLLLVVVVVLLLLLRRLIILSTWC